VVDYSSNKPLSGIPVSIAPWATPKPYSQPSGNLVATTDGRGRFEFKSMPGSYMLIIGSNGGTDVRATVHDYVTVVPGRNRLRAPGPWKQPDYTPPKSESSGRFRLMLLDPTTQVPCVRAANALRSSHNLPGVVPDEWLEEETLDALHSAYNGGFGVLFTNGASAHGHYLDCAETVQNISRAATSFFLYRYSPWFGGVNVRIPKSKNGIAEFAEVIDPRIDFACSQKSDTQLPGPTRCDPNHFDWPQQPGYNPFVGRRPQIM
jgi:hypothetical protein